VEDHSEDAVAAEEAPLGAEVEVDSLQEEEVVEEEGAEAVAGKFLNEPAQF
jgi:hypothetical protein